jgi:hypothetical protein
MRTFILLIFLLLQFSLLAQKPPNQWSVIYRSGFNTNIYFSNITPELVNIRGFKPVSYVGLGYNKTLNEKSDIILEVLYGDGGHRIKSKYNGLKSDLEFGNDVLYESSVHSIFIPIGYQRNFNKLSLSAGLAMQALVGGEQFYSVYNSTYNKYYYDFSDHFKLGCQIKASFSVMNHGNKQFLLEPYFFSNLDHISTSNIGVAFKYGIDKK